MNTSKETKEELEHFIKHPYTNGVSDVAMEEIYNVGTCHGLFSGYNHGVRDRQNSVCSFLETLKCLTK
jgi:hypothetical protein